MCNRNTSYVFAAQIYWRCVLSVLLLRFMQENRAFDHYYGKLKGVRGFNDRSAPLLPSGVRPFQQPVSPPKPHSIMCGCLGTSSRGDFVLLVSMQSVCACLGASVR